jgi:hypothetical protein
MPRRPKRPAQHMSAREAFVEADALIWDAINTVGKARAFFKSGAGDIRGSSEDALMDIAISALSIARGNLQDYDWDWDKKR